MTKKMWSKANTAREMWAAWRDHDNLLWNSQHFALRLTFLILNDQSQAQSEDAMMARQVARPSIRASDDEHYILYCSFA
jgi:hypothetical protein